MPQLPVSICDPPPPLPTSGPVIRFIGCDLSKHSVVVAAVDRQQQLVLQPKKIATEKFALWAAQNLRPSDAVVIEAGWQTWYYYDLLEPLAGRVVVANPYKVRLIAQTKVKTDARDAVALARLLAADLVPTVWVPPKEVRELRLLVAHRHRLVAQRTQARNRLHSLLATHNILPPAGKPFSQANASWWQTLVVPTTTRLVIQQQLSLLQSLQPLIDQIEQELALLSTNTYWRSQTAFLIQLPGLGVISAMVILSAIGEINRFAKAKQLVGYAGLGAAIHASGNLARGGRITKQGRVELRTALVEAAWLRLLEKTI